ncbi:MAG: type II toxin-antitoxin system RelE/ParE family toxin [Candidatus Omnitrophota bacterium]
MKYALKIIPKAQKDLGDIHGKDFESIKKKILSLSNTPRPLGSQKLTIEEGYRVRVGNFRILYRIDETVKEIMIYRVKHRKEAYR